MIERHDPDSEFAKTVYAATAAAFQALHTVIDEDDWKLQLNVCMRMAAIIAVYHGVPGEDLRGFMDKTVEAMAQTVEAMAEPPPSSRQH